MRVRVTKHFGDRVLFDGFDFSVEEGSIVRLTGPSGRGKTTLLRIISGLEENEDKSLSDFSGHSFAWVFQEDRLTFQHRPGTGAHCGQEDHPVGLCRARPG